MSISRQSTNRPHLERRARIIDSVRRFFTAAGFLEIETPVRIPAPAPEVHIDAEPSGGWFLHTSPELCMKRLLASGYEKIFQICRCFRQGERGGRHLPEMTLLEWYAANVDYLALMTQCEALIGFVAGRMGVGRHLIYQGQAIDLMPPWDRLSVDDAFGRMGGMTAEQALDRDRFDEIMGVDIEPHLGMHRPVFLYNYPARRGALARLSAEDPSVAERFELYIGGVELCNAFSELTDPTEQRTRFEAQNLAREFAQKTVYPTPEPFLKALEAMPPAAGNALGLDRLVMLFSDAATIDQVVAFTPEDL